MWREWRHRQGGSRDRLTSRDGVRPKQDEAVACYFHLTRPYKRAPIERLLFLVGAGQVCLAVPYLILFPAVIRLMRSKSPGTRPADDD